MDRATTRRARVSPQTRERQKSLAAIIGALIVIAVIVWVDIATGLWNDYVIMAGLAAGLVSFLLTVLVLNRIVARATERKWAPVNRLALSEFLHAIADEKHSEISRGQLVPRSLTAVEPSDDLSQVKQQLHDLRHEVVNERRLLSSALSSWAQFLSASGSNEQVLTHIADIAVRLDRVRDTALEAERAPSEAALAALAAETSGYNSSMLELEAELRKQIAHEDQLIR